jgi:hypothetical protein
MQSMLPTGSTAAVKAILLLQRTLAISLTTAVKATLLPQRPAAQAPLLRRYRPKMK